MTIVEGISATQSAKAQTGFEDQHQDSNTCFLLRLDSLVATFGVLHKETLNGPDDLIVGDCFKAAQQSQFRVSVRDTADFVSTIELMDSVLVGHDRISAKASHDITLMRDDGNVLSGVVMSGRSNAKGSDFALFHEEMVPGAEYTLIEKTKLSNRLPQQVRKARCQDLDQPPIRKVG